MRVNNHIVRLLGEKMVDEIDSLLPCLGIIFVKNFAIPVWGMIFFLHSKNPIFYLFNFP
jgi:hypothetical protein